MTVFLGSLLLILAFCAGIFAGHYKTLPFRLLVKIRRRWLWRAKAGFREHAGTFPIELVDGEAVSRRRARLQDYVWGSAGVPHELLPDVIESGHSHEQYRRFTSYANLEVWVVKMRFGIDSKVLILSPRNNVRQTVVLYHQGHEGDVMHGAGVLLRLVQEGFHVAAFAMPLLGPNSRPEVVFARHGRIALAEHNVFHLLDHEFKMNSMRFFFDPIAACVNKLAAQGFHSIAMVGSSGGGWATAVYAALDERVAMSVPVASSLPFSLRLGGEMPDYEQHKPEFYAIANFPELHVLGASGNRYQLQIFNEYDPVMWAGRRGKAYEAAVKDALLRSGGGRFEVLIDDSWTGHGISAFALRRIIRELCALEVSRT